MRSRHCLLGAALTFGNATERLLPARRTSAGGRGSGIRSPKTARRFSAVSGCTVAIRELSSSDKVDGSRLSQIANARWDFPLALHSSYRKRANASFGRPARRSSYACPREQYSASAVETLLVHPGNLHRRRSGTASPSFTRAPRFSPWAHASHSLPSRAFSGSPRSSHSSTASKRSRRGKPRLVGFMICTRRFMPPERTALATGNPADARIARSQADADNASRRILSSSAAVTSSSISLRRAMMPSSVRAHGPCSEHVRAPGVRRRSQPGAGQVPPFLSLYRSLDRALSVTTARSAPLGPFRVPASGTISGAWSWPRRDPFGLQGTAQRADERGPDEQPGVPYSWPEGTVHPVPTRHLPPFYAVGRTSWRYNGSVPQTTTVWTMQFVVPTVVVLDACT